MSSDDTFCLKGVAEAKCIVQYCIVSLYTLFLFHLFFLSISAHHEIPSDENDLLLLDTLLSYIRHKLNR